MTQPTKVGILGTGNISPNYLIHIKQFDNVEVIALADVDMDAAKARAKEFGVERVLTPEGLFADSEIEIVVSLTPPQAHTETLKRALHSGKHGYTEKPFALNRDDAKRTLSLARERGLRVGGAPDTFLGIGIQTARRAIDEGMIGEPVAATAFMVGHGHESWHPNPEFYYKVGGGPLFDMGPYYLTALVNLVGPVKRVGGMSRVTFPERVIGSEPKRGQVITVDTPTHITSSLEFGNGALGTMIMSFDVWRHQLPIIEIHGTETSLRVPDPNHFGGDVEIFNRTSGEWEIVKPRHTHSIGRGLGVAEMAWAIVNNKPHRANGELCAHVTDIMQSVLEAAEAGKTLTLSTTTERPEMMPTELKEGQLEA